MFNPTLYLDLAAHGYIELYLGFGTWIYSVDFSGYRYTPLDLSLVWDLVDKSAYCYGLSWATLGLEAQMNTQWLADECQIGYFAYTDDKTYKCLQRRYVPDEQLWQKSLSALLGMEVNRLGDYIPYKCSNEQY